MEMFTVYIGTGENNRKTDTLPLCTVCIVMWVKGLNIRCTKMGLRDHRWLNFNSWIDFFSSTLEYNAVQYSITTNS